MSKKWRVFDTCRSVRENCNTKKFLLVINLIPFIVSSPLAEALMTENRNKDSFFYRCFFISLFNIYNFYGWDDSCKDFWERSFR
jgi:hypothetical protein